MPPRHIPTLPAAPSSQFQITDDPPFANTAPFVGVSYFTDLPYGLSVRLGSQFTFRRYDEEFAAFGLAQLDRILTVSTNVTYVG